MPSAVSQIDRLRRQLAESNYTVAALIVEMKTLRRQIADRDGQISQLQAAVAAAKAAQ